MPAVVDNSELQNYGPAMLALNEKQRKFVEAKVLRPGITNRDAAILAGLSPQHSAYLLRQDKILLAMKEVAGSLLHEGVLDGARAIIEIARDPLHKDRLKAAESLLARAGMGLIAESHLTVTHRMSEGEQVSRIKELAAQVGLTKKETATLLGSVGIVDAEFTEVDPATIALEEEWSV